MSENYSTILLGVSQRGFPPGLVSAVGRLPQARASESRQPASQPASRPAGQTAFGLHAGCLLTSQMPQKCWTGHLLCTVRDWPPELPTANKPPSAAQWHTGCLLAPAPVELILVPRLAGIWRTVVGNGLGNGMTVDGDAGCWRASQLASWASGPSLEVGRLCWTKGQTDRVVC